MKDTKEIADADYAKQYTDWHEMKDTKEIADADYAKQYTDWHEKTGGFARDKTLRDYFAAEAMRPSMFSKPTYGNWDEVAKNAYKMADAMLKERNK